ncbi:MAG: TIGR02147 family protein [Gemmatimonadales bacterium]|nr:TIGR02147 family protein [Gemmatimonadales bacterium]
MKTTLEGSLRERSTLPSFRRLLQVELGRRCARNPRYSLRAFANFLGVDHATLSQLLRGKRRLTDRTIRKLGVRLGFDGPAIDGFVANEIQGAGSELLETRLAEQNRLSVDLTRLVNDWEHFALLELLRLDGFRPDIRWIARVLDLTPDEVTLVVDRLVRLGLLVMESRTRWIDTMGDAVTRLPALAKEAMRPPGEFATSRTTIAASRARVPGAVQRIDRFRRELAEYLKGEGPRDELFELEIHFNSLTTTHHP